MPLRFSVTLAAVAVPVVAALYDYAVSCNRPIMAVRWRLTTTQRVTALIGFLVLIIAQFLLALAGHTGSAPACASDPLTIPTRPVDARRRENSGRMAHCDQRDTTGSVPRAAVPGCGTGL